MKIPDRWLDYKALGDRIQGTPFICFKTPLHSGFHQTDLNRDGLETKDQFPPSKLLELVKDLGCKLGTVIDLTNTFRYYHGAREFGKLGIQYFKLKCVGHEVPAEDVYQQFLKKVTDTMPAKKGSKDHTILIGVHCTHGVNRTGYLVCRYLIENCSFSPKDAIDAFNAARGHNLERENYIIDLLQRTKSLTMQKRGLAVANDRHDDDLHSSEAVPRKRRRSSHGKDYQHDHVYPFETSRTSSWYRNGPYSRRVVAQGTFQSNLPVRERRNWGHNDSHHYQSSRPHPSSSHSYYEDISHSNFYRGSQSGPHWSDDHTEYDRHMQHYNDAYNEEYYGHEYSHNNHRRKHQSKWYSKKGPYH